jgi:DNA replication protein DnaC
MMMIDGGMIKMDVRGGTTVTALRKKLTVEDYHSMNLSRKFWDASYNDIPEGQHKNIVEKYLRNLDENVRKGYGLLLFGNNGVGKTSIAAVILKECRRRGYRCFFGRSAELLDAFENKISYTEGISVWDRCVQVDALVIDDFGHEKNLFGGREMAIWERLLRERSDNFMATFLTMNMHMDEFKERYSNYVSIMSVLTEMVFPVVVAGDDLRSLNAERLAQEMLDK